MRRFALVIFALCALAAPSRADEILFEEGFGAGFDGTDWIASEGAWSLDGTHVRTGATALRLTDPADYYVTYDLATAMTDAIVEVWFYDDLVSTNDTHVGITAASDYLTSTNGHLLVGTDCEYAPNNYLVSEGWHSVGFFQLGPPRSEGWHQVRFENVGGTNLCFLDGALLHTTTFQGDWRTLVLMENNKCTSGSSWFDDAKVYRQEPVRAEPISFGLVKALFKVGSNGAIGGPGVD